MRQVRLVALLLLFLANSSRADSIDDLEDIGFDESAVSVRVVSGVTVTISTHSGDSLRAKTYNLPAPDGRAFTGHGGGPNDPAIPENVSGTRFISTALNGTSGLFSSVEPIIFEFDTPVAEFGLTTLDLMENGISESHQLRLSAFDEGGVLVDSHERTGPQGASGLDLDWRVTGTGIVRAEFTGTVGAFGSGYGIDDLVVRPPGSSVVWYDNGHTYEYRHCPDGIDWESAQAECLRSGGNLATITSAEENDLVHGLIDGAQIDSGVWLGGLQMESAAEPADGWSWITGDTMSYQNWEVGEPNDGHPTLNEDRITFFTQGGVVHETWNDVPGTVLLDGYVLEIVSHNSTYEAASELTPPGSCPIWTEVVHVGGTASVGGGVLTVSTTIDNERVWYEQSGPDIDLSTAFTFECRMRFVSGATSEDSRGQAVVGWDTSYGWNRLYIDNDRVFLLDDNLDRGPTFFGPTSNGMHTYRVHVATSGQVEVYRDGVHILSGTTFGEPRQERLHFGQSTFLAHGTSEWEFVRHNAHTSPCMPGTSAPRSSSHTTMSVFPNPFNPSTSIRFNLPSATSAQLQIFDLRGRLVDSLLDGVMEKGRHAVTWDGTDLRGKEVASGIYFARLITSSSTLSNRLLLLK